MQEISQGKSREALPTVIDTNIIISALIKASTTRRIISKGYFYTPDYTFEEIFKHRRLIEKKSGIIQLDRLIHLLFSTIEVVPMKKYSRYLNQIHLNDSDDQPFIALALHLKGTIWTNDKGFNKQDIVPIFTTKDMILRD